MKNIILTNHAKYRLFERGIDVHQVKKVVKNGSIVKSDLDGTMTIKGVTDNGKTLEIIGHKQNNKFIIKTAYYAS